MPQIKTEIVVANDVQKNGEYEIIDVSDFASPKGDKGIKVTLNSLDKTDKKVYSTILWLRGQIGANSKLGAFIMALEPIDEETGIPKSKSFNTDKWLKANIRVLDWEDRKRKIEVIA